MEEEKFENEVIDELSERISNSLNLIWNYAHLKDSEHKTWLIDQILQALTGNEDDYTEWIEEYESTDDNSTEELIWDFGTEPE